MWTHNIEKWLNYVNRDYLMKKLLLWHLLSVPQQMLASPFLGLNRNNAKQTWKKNTGQLLLRRLRLLNVQDSFCEGMGTIVRSPMPTHRNVSHIYDPITERGRDLSRGIIGNAGHQPTWKKFVSFSFSENSP